MGTRVDPVPWTPLKPRYLDPAASIDMLVGPAHRLIFLLGALRTGLVAVCQAGTQHRGGFGQLIEGRENGLPVGRLDLHAPRP